LEHPETDAEKRAQYRQRLEQHEAAVEGVRRSFDIDVFIADVAETLEVEVPDLAYLRTRKRIEALVDAGALSDDAFEKALAALEPRFIVVKYKRLTNEDILQLNRIKDDGERGLQTLYLFLSKANPSITFDKLKAIDPLLTSRISRAITEQTPLFLH
jgi:hypothetical protein